MRILWLCSWYPHSMDMFNGDFIERQAKALAVLNPVDVIHIVQNRNILANAEPHVEESTSERVHATIYFIRNKQIITGSTNYIFFNGRYHYKLYKVLNQYIKAYGKPDLVHIQVPVKMGIGAIWLKKKFEIPFVITEHANVYHENEWVSIENSSAYFKKVTVKAIEQCNRLITVSHFLGKAIQQYAIPKDFIIIPNVVDTSLFYFKEKERNSKFRFLHVSNMAPVKNPVVMLQAVKLVCNNDKEVEFVFVGSDSDVWQQKAIANGIPADQIRFFGELSYGSVACEMQQADAFFIFSKSETFSCVTAEALCCGLPVAATAVGALPELLTNSNAVLAQTDDAMSLARALIELKENYQRFQRKAIASEASEKFKYSNVARQIMNVYKDVISKQN